MKATSHEAVSPISPGNARGSQTADRLRLIFVWAVWTVGTLSLLLHVRHYARNIPWLDDWALVPMITGHEANILKWAWAQHNEHRLLVPKLIFALLCRWVAFDFRTGMYLNAGLLSSAAAMMIVLAHRLRGHQRLTDTVLPLSILTLAQSEALLWNYTLALVLSAWLTFGLICVLGRASQRPPWMTVLPIGIAVVILPLSAGSGLATLPPLVIWLVGYLCWGWWSGREPGGWARALGLSSLMACSAIIALYLSDYVHPAIIPLPPSLAAIVGTALEFLSLSISPSSAAIEYRMAASLTILALVAGTLIRLSLVATRSPRERPRAIGFAAVIVSIMSVALSVGVSRSGFGTWAGLASRYVSLVAPLISALYFAWMLYTPARFQRVLQTCLLLVVCANIPYAVNEARQRASLVFSTPGGWNEP